MYAKLIFLSCLISITNARLIARAFFPSNLTLIETDFNSTDSCLDVNEEFLECGDPCEPSCDNPTQGRCRHDCLDNVCQCIPGYFRNGDGTCVVGSECEAKTACYKDLLDAFKEGMPPLGRMVVNCNDEGLFELMQCHSSAGYCWCVVQETGEEINGTRKEFSEGRVSCAPMTDCEKEQSEATKDGPPAPGQFVVQCSDDGDYEPMQCHGSTGECWCVDIYTGEETNGTRTTLEAGPRDCYVPPPYLTVEPSEFNCTDTEEFLECGKQCEHSCENPSPFECPNRCIPACACKSGYFRHSSGACVDAAMCEAKGPCHEQVFAMATTLATGIERPLVPNCNTDGTYSSTQCDDRMGDCWCVNTDDLTEISGTRTSLSEEIVNCEEL